MVHAGRLVIIVDGLGPVLGCEAQGQVEQSQKLSIVGQIAAGVAHEIKNPLASIKGATDILTDDSTSPEERDEFKDILQNEVKRIDATVTEFLEFARPKISVNCVAPGATETQMTAGIPEDIKKGISSKIPMRRFAAPAEIASAHLFFASDDSSYVTGQVLVVDGGMFM